MPLKTMEKSARLDSCGSLMGIQPTWLAQRGSSLEGLRASIRHACWNPRFTMEPPAEKAALAQVPVPWFIAEPWEMGREQVEHTCGRGGERPIRIWRASDISESESGSYSGEELSKAPAQLSWALMYLC